MAAFKSVQGHTLRRMSQISYLQIERNDAFACKGTWPIVLRSGRYDPRRTVGAKHTTRRATPAARAKGCAHSKGGSCTPLGRLKKTKINVVFAVLNKTKDQSATDYRVMARSAST